MPQSRQTHDKHLIRIGVSSCLLGRKVRFDAGHKCDRFVTDILGQYVDFVPVCPEIDIGMGVPREAVRLVGVSDNPRMLGNKTGTDWTDRMNRYSRNRARSLARENLSGYILRSKSPSCGMERVKLFDESGQSSDKRTSGLYAGHLLRTYPDLPVEEEGRLNGAGLRENFIVRVFAYHRFQETLGGRFKRSDAIRFHTIHKYLILAHSSKHYTQLGRLVADIKNRTPSEFRDAYRELLMQGMSVKSSPKKNVNVLQHILGFLKKHLSAEEKRYTLGVIDDYHRQLVPLVAPITLLRHFVTKFEIEYVRDQVYLNPHPKELMLRNHV